MPTRYELLTYLPEAIRIARQAGAEIMTHYHEDANGLNIEVKDDDSPVTKADLASHGIIIDAVSKLTPDIPILSEENAVQPDVSDGLFWAVDPLDGTKGFIHKNDLFAVKITLMENFQPVLAVILEPARQNLYYATRDTETAWHVDQTDSARCLKTRSAPIGGNLTTLFNGMHYNPESYAALRLKLETYGLATPQQGNANGTCKTLFYTAVARGIADIYMNCGQREDLTGGNGYSWDYAPDCLILEKAGGVIVDVTTGTWPVFNKPTDNMNAMVGLGDRAFAEKYFPLLKRDCN